jgi:NADP-dependent 3-hydroxy acid dehydrogenase YdfG
MKSFENKVAAITGAGSGIGRALAYHLARQGCHLALSDVNVEGLKETAEQARKLGVTVSSSVSTSPTAPPSRPGPSRSSANSAGSMLSSTMPAWLRAARSKATTTPTTSGS